MQPKWTAEKYAQIVENTSVKWAKTLIRLSGARIHITGLENIPKDRTVLYVSNHQSDFDIIVCIYGLPGPKGFIAKIEMLKVPLLRTWMRYMRCLFMDRKDIKQSMRIILEGITLLKSGHNMVVFPEGTRSKSDNMLEFKAGSFKLATKSKAPIIPITISGSYKIIEGNNYKIKPADIYVTVHPPVYTDSLTAEDASALPEKVKSIIAESLQNQLPVL